MRMNNVDRSVRKVVVAAVLAASTVTLVGCGAANQGGATPCKAYVAMSSSDQANVIKKYLADKGKSPSNGEITLNRLSAVAFCKTMGHDSDPISKIETG